MTEQQRTRLRLKQDFLVMLAGMSNYEEYLRIDEKDTAPSIAQLRIAVYPDWEGIVDGHIQSMANRMSPKVGVPDFAYLAASMPHTHNYECIDASGRI
jgi:uncharacterized short protein YbdD (DUF466 family)